MIIKINHKPEHSAPIMFAVPIGTDVEIQLYPGDIPTIEPHNDRKNTHNVRAFDISVSPNGDLHCDHVNVTKVANGEA